MTSRFEQSDIDRIMAENVDLAKVNQGNPMNAIARMTPEKREELKREINKPDPPYRTAEIPVVQEKRTEAVSDKPKRTQDNKHERAIKMIVVYAHLKSWRVVFFRAGRTKDGWRTPVGADGKGFPDLFLVGTGINEFQFRFWEVKIPPDKLRPEQREWLELVGGNVVNPFDDASWEFIRESLDD